MKLNPGWLIAMLLPMTGLPATLETAWTTAFCYSLQFERGSDAARTYSLDLTTSTSILNGELAQDYMQSGYTHSTFVNLRNEALGKEFSGRMGLDVPRGKDGNGDGFE